MKNSDLSLMGVHEMNPLDLQETEGGLVLVILGVCAAVLCLSSCINGPVIIQVGSINSATTSGSATMSADSSRLEIPIDVPIGY